MAELMRDDGLQLSRRQALDDAFGQQQHRAPHTDHTRLQEKR